MTHKFRAGKNFGVFRARYGRVSFSLNMYFSQFIQSRSKCQLMFQVSIYDPQNEKFLNPLLYPDDKKTNIILVTVVL